MKKLLTLLFILITSISYSQVKSYNYIGVLTAGSTLDNPIIDEVEEENTRFFLTDSIIYYSSRLTPMMEIRSNSIDNWDYHTNFRYYETDELMVIYDSDNDDIYFIFANGLTYIFFN